MPSFRETIRQALPPEIRDIQIPKGFKRIGSLMILRSREEIPEIVGNIVMEKFSWCTGVFQQTGTLGENRRPILRHLAGNPTTITKHKENGVVYVLDAGKITFSGGNRNLRQRILKEVKDGEKLLDMFAAVGNLSMQPIVHRQIDYILVERDPITYSYLLKTLYANGKKTEKAFNIDCREIELENWADRVLMGYHEVDHTHLKVATQALKSSGTIHLHPLEKREKVNQRVEKYIEILKKQSISIEETQIFEVKKFAPRISHFELVFKVQKL
ncbi:MAG: hypothetical protein D6732_19040 [Methanobacteriota archaeon]|nr:MAG: hypothetical protein D6732_19040 [Euryarchaeota archaeon]